MQPIKDKHDICIREKMCYCPNERPTMSRKKVELPPAEPLIKGQGLRVKGFVSGFSSKETSDGQCVVTLHAGLVHNGKNVFSIALPYQMGFDLVGQDVDIIVVPTGPRFPDAT